MKRLLFIPLLLFFSCNNDDSSDPISPAEQLANDVSQIDQYLSDNNIVAEKDQSGLRYVITEEGTGDNPSLINNVKVKYEGRLLSNNTVFDSNSNGISFPLSRLILGWQIGIPKMKAGGKATLFIPSGLGYGPSGQGPIPQNANLIFDIELVEFN